MIKTLELQVKPEFADSHEFILQTVCKSLKVSSAEVTDVVVGRRSLDARSKAPFYHLRVHVYLGEKPAPVSNPLQLQPVNTAPRVLILGAGPAGLFAALKLISLGIKPVIVERGKPVRERRRDLALIGRQGKVDPDSNYCFGEGGAGTYSDGKLYSRSGAKEDLELVLRLLVSYGASHSILSDSRAHIGTNKLPAIITAISNAIIASGGEIHFNTRVEDILIKNGRFDSFKDHEGKLWKGVSAIIAGGHSARDVFQMLYEKNILLEPKGFAVGVRIEHDQNLINTLQYHSQHPDPYLPAANYQLVEQVGERGVFSFCMCPGGIIAPCATAANEIVVNGWSPSKRNNPWANSGMVVQINPRDVKGSAMDALALLKFQAQIEAAAFKAGGGHLRAPAQRLVDFVEKRSSATLPGSSYHPGLTSSHLEDFLPGLVIENLRQAFPLFGKKMKGFYTNDAVLVGVESRTSSPVRIPRNSETLEHPQISGLYPCGEGAGYAGGIMSAAIDGLHVAGELARKQI